MKIKLIALASSFALASLTAVAQPAGNGCDGKAEASACDSKAQLAAECDGAKTCSPSAKAELASAGDCEKAESACSGAKAELASAGDCEKAKSECSGAKAELASAKATPLHSKLRALMHADRISAVVLQDRTLTGAEAASAVEGMIECATACRIKSACEESAACEKTLASNVDKALTDACMGGELASLVESGKVRGIVVGEDYLRGRTAIVAVAKYFAHCPEFQADCAKLDEQLASASATCTKSPALASATVTPLHGKLAALLTKERIAGVVVDGETLCGADAVAKVEGMVHCRTQTAIKANCEASAKCEKTLASNVEKTLSDACIATELAGLMEAGYVDGVVVEGKTLAGAEALEAVEAFLSCPVYQSECGATEASAKAECDATQASAEAGCEATRAAAEKKVCPVTGSTLQ